jgi:hypothetical protein
MIVDTGDFDMSARKTPLPLFKVGSAEMLPAEGDIAFSAGAVPRGWKLFPAEEGYGYMLQRVGFAIFLR